MKSQLRLIALETLVYNTWQFALLVNFCPPPILKICRASRNYYLRIIPRCAEGCMQYLPGAVLQNKVASPL